MIISDQEEPITYLYNVTQGIFYKTDLLINAFIGKLFLDR